MKMTLIFLNSLLFVMYSLPCVLILVEINVEFRLLVVPFSVQSLIIVKTGQGGTVSPSQSQLGTSRNRASPPRTPGSPRAAASGGRFLFFYIIMLFTIADWVYVISNLNPPTVMQPLDVDLTSLVSTVKRQAEENRLRMRQKPTLLHPSTVSRELKPDKKKKRKSKKQTDEEESGMPF